MHPDSPEFNFYPHFNAPQVRFYVHGSTALQMSSSGEKPHKALTLVCYYLLTVEFGAVCEVIMIC